MEDHMAADNNITPQLIPVIDPKLVDTKFVDWLVTCGQIENVLNITFGVINQPIKGDSSDGLHVEVASKLRMTLDMAERVHAVIGNVLAQAGRGAAVTPPDSIRNKLN